jgi:hypothetical protein
LTGAICRVRWLAVACVCAHLALANSPQTKNVLILYSFTARDAMDEFGVVESAVRSRNPGPVKFQVEYLDALRFDAPGYEQGLSATLAATYRSKRSTW